MKEPLTHGEFHAWLQENFFPHNELERENRSKVTRLTAAMFGDGNGDSGVHADVKSLMETNTRVNNWLDGIKIIGRLGGWAVGIAMGVVIIGSALKWW